MATHDILAWVSLVLLHLAATTEAAQQPNIVFVLADDLGFNDVGYHGSEITTPNIDHLATNGVILENYYVQPICSPSRCQFLSGKYQIRYGLQHQIIWPSQPLGLPTELPTVANMLKENGYSTHAIGKWHVGMYTKAHTPLQRGFDTFYGFLTGGESYFTHYKCDVLHEGILSTEDFRSKKRRRGPDKSGRQLCGYDLRDNETPVKNETGTYSTHLFTRKAVDVVNDAAKRQKPFFLYLAYQAVHMPLQVPESYKKPYHFIKNSKRRTYAGLVNAMDEGIGTVTKALKDSGLWNNTIFIFSSDNGGSLLGGGNNWPLRGHKNGLWEGGIRAVGFVTSPLLSHPGRVSKDMMHITDWFPTFAGIAGAKLSESLSLDGVDQWPMIRDGSKGKRYEILHNIDMWESLNGEPLYNDTFDTRLKAAIRVGRYKLLTGVPGASKWYPPPKTEADAVPFEVPEKVVQPTNVWLFDIVVDPNEQNDLASTLPHRVRDLLDRLNAYNATAVTPVYPYSDPKSDPQLHGGFWSPWQ